MAGGDPVSWLLIEEGWEVADRDDERFGRVERVLGDEEKDIFDGLAVATGLFGRPRYLPAERVGTIVEGRVGTDLAPGEADALGTWDPIA
jgi:hypothetical protein